MRGKGRIGYERVGYEREGEWSGVERRLSQMVRFFLICQPCGVSRRRERTISTCTMMFTSNPGNIRMMTF